MKALHKRSSFPAGMVTGLVGWNGFVVLAALLMGWRGAPWALFGLASLTGMAQVALLWPSFYLRLRLDRGTVARGALWGALSGTALFAPWLAVTGLAEHAAAWLAVAAYTGAPVGAFLAYFFRDDARLASEVPSSVGSGRDAHWLEPFVYGAGVFAVVRLPRSVNATVYTLLVGALTGVVAAGVSHFTPDAWKGSTGRVLALCALGGGIGLAGGFSLRHHLATALVTGPGAGALTLLVTLLRGQALAAKERAGALTDPR
jgi:hypothetical protein